MAIALRLVFVIVALFAIRAFGLIGLGAVAALAYCVEAWRKRKTPPL